MSGFENVRGNIPGNNSTISYIGGNRKTLADTHEDGWHLPKESIYGVVGFLLFVLLVSFIMPMMKKIKSKSSSNTEANNTDKPSSAEV